MLAILEFSTLRLDVRMVVACVAALYVKELAGGILHAPVVKPLHLIQYAANSTSLSSMGRLQDSGFYNTLRLWQIEPSNPLTQQTCPAADLQHKATLMIHATPKVLGMHIMNASQLCHHIRQAITVCGLDQLMAYLSEYNHIGHEISAVLMHDALRNGIPARYVAQASSFGLRHRVWPAEFGGGGSMHGGMWQWVLEHYFLEPSSLWKRFLSEVCSVQLAYTDIFFDCFHGFGHGVTTMLAVQEYHLSRDPCYPIEAKSLPPASQVYFAKHCDVCMEAPSLEFAYECMHGVEHSLANVVSPGSMTRMTGLLMPCSYRPCAPVACFTHLFVGRFSGRTKVLAQYPGRLSQACISEPMSSELHTRACIYGLSSGMFAMFHQALTFDYYGLNGSALGRAGRCPLPGVLEFEWMCNMVRRELYVSRIDNSKPLATLSLWCIRFLSQIPDTGFDELRLLACVAGSSKSFPGQYAAVTPVTHDAIRAHCKQLLKLDGQTKNLQHMAFEACMMRSLWHRREAIRIQDFQLWDTHILERNISMQVPDEQLRSVRHATVLTGPDTPDAMALTTAARRAAIDNHSTKPPGHPAATAAVPRSQVAA